MKLIAWVFAAFVAVVALVALSLGIDHFTGRAPAGQNVVSNQKACSAYVQLFDNSSSTLTAPSATLAEANNVVRLGRAAQSEAIQGAASVWSNLTVENPGFAEFAEACDSIGLGPDS